MAVGALSLWSTILVSSAGASVTTSGRFVTSVTFTQRGNGTIYKIRLPPSSRWVNASSDTALTKAYNTNGDVFLVQATGKPSPGNLSAYLDFSTIDPGSIPTDTSLAQYQQNTVLRQPGISNITTKTFKVGVAAPNDKNLRKFKTNVSEASYNATEQVSHAPVRVTDILMDGPDGWYTIELQATPSTWPSLHAALEKALAGLRWHQPYPAPFP